MRRLSFALAIPLVLAACASQHTARFALSFDITDKSVQQSLTATSMRVIARRVEHLNEKMLASNTETKGSGTTISVTLSTADGVATLIQELTSPFKVRVMAQTGSGETADITVRDRGGFRETGITEKDLQWVDARKNPANDKGEVRLDFTKDGQKKMQALFKQIIGHDIGLFVRDKLVSQLHVQTDSPPESIVIHDVPSADIAQVFADDMDVGLHVTFTSLP